MAQAPSHNNILAVSSLQAGAYIDQGPRFLGAVNVSASKFSHGYTAFAQTDLQNYIDLVVDVQDGDHCTSTNSNYISDVDTCSKANINSQCCLQLNSTAIQVNICVSLGTRLLTHDFMYITQLSVQHNKHWHDTCWQLSHYGACLLCMVSLCTSAGPITCFASTCWIRVAV